MLPWCKFVVSAYKNDVAQTVARKLCVLHLQVCSSLWWTQVGWQFRSHCLKSSTFMTVFSKTMCLSAWCKADLSSDYTPVNSVESIKSKEFKETYIYNIFTREAKGRLTPWVETHLTVFLACLKKSNVFVKPEITCEKYPRKVCVFLFYSLTGPSFYRLTFKPSLC